MQKKIFSVILCISFCTALFAKSKNSFYSLFDNSWKENEIENLEKGQVIIRNIRRVKHISILKNKNPHVDKMLLDFEQLDPAYLAEIIFKMPKNGNQSIIEQAKEIFCDINLYKKIIYTDERKNKSRPLFPLVEQKNRTQTANEICIQSRLQMDMLSAYDSELVVKTDEFGFFFEQRNTSPLFWRNIQAVKSKKMVASICCFECEESFYVYALGGIKAPKIPFVMYEIERQFIGRIKDFTVFYINLFKIKK